MKAYIIIGSLLLISFPSQAQEAKKVATEDTLKFPLVLHDSYMRMIRNSVGSRIFRNLYFKIKQKPVDALENGNLACAYYVSMILRHFDLIKEWRTSVDGLVLEMKENGWRLVDKPKIGSVIVWEGTYNKRSGETHKHIGFFIGDGKAISTSSARGCPVVHSFRRDVSTKMQRRVVEILWHPKLG